MAETKKSTRFGTVSANEASITDFAAATAPAFEQATDAVKEAAAATAEAMRAGPTAAFSGSAFEFSKMEIPAAYRDAAEKAIAQAKQNYDRFKTAAEEATDLIESSYVTASRGSTEYMLKLIDTTRMNANAHFDFARALWTAKSPSEAVEVSSAHARKQFETLSAQTKELTSLAQKVSTDTAEPIKAGLSKAMRVAA